MSKRLWNQEVPLCKYKGRGCCLISSFLNTIHCIEEDYSTLYYTDSPCKHRRCITGLKLERKRPCYWKKRPCYYWISNISCDLKLMFVIVLLSSQAVMITSQKLIRSAFIIISSLSNFKIIPLLYSTLQRLLFLTMFYVSALFRFPRLYQI